MADGETAAVAEKERTFLCIVDEREESSRALRYACRRAWRTGGRVALLYVIEPAEFQHWSAVGNLMQDERREEAEELVQVVAAVVQKSTGRTPVLHIREGKLNDELIALLEEGMGISVLVLAASPEVQRPGGLVPILVEKMVGRLRVPVTIVPGDLSDAEIDAIT